MDYEKKLIQFQRKMLKIIYDPYNTFTWQYEIRNNEDL